MLNINEVIDRYADNKIEFDNLKKLCDEDNKIIKDMFNEMDISEASSDKYKAKIIVQNRDTMDENRALALAKKYGITSIIKTKEYVDPEALEDYIYNNSLSAEFISDLKRCTIHKEVKLLKVMPIKKEENNNGIRK